MLKTLSTKSVKPSKSIVKVSGNRKRCGNRVEPVGRDEIDNSKIKNDKVRKS